MDIQSLSGRMAWSQFYTVANAAKARNSGLANNLISKDTKSSSVHKKYTAQLIPANKEGMNAGQQVSAKPKRTVGMRFDAYA